MSHANINRVTITGNLTRDPELRALPSGLAVCTLRVACNGHRKNPDTGGWDERPNFFDVTVWGSQAEVSARYLSRGRAVAVDGRLEWHEWDTAEGQRRQSVQIVADTVQFLGGPRAAEAAGAEPAGAEPADEDRQPEGAGVGPDESASGSEVAATF